MTNPPWRETLAKVGWDTAGARLVRVGENAVFRLARAPVIVRIARSTAMLEDARREIMVSHWLAAEGIPAVKAWPVAQPVVADGRVATFWEAAADHVEYGSPAELAQLLKRVHALTPPPELGLTPLAPFARALARLSDHDDGFLRERCHTLIAAYGRLAFQLPQGVIHGVANVGNVIRDRNGTALLSDLDRFCVGPREWDLAPTAVYFDRFGWHTEAEYLAFTTIYGHDVMAWDGYEVLRDTRELLMVTWLAQNANSHNAAGIELAKRLHALRTGASRRNWVPF